MVQLFKVSLDFGVRLAIKSCRPNGNKIVKDISFKFASKKTKKKNAVLKYIKKKKYKILSNHINKHKHDLAMRNACVVS
jgi:hypothetical protein